MITTYHRPATLDEALALVRQPGSMIVSGGTAVNSRPELAADSAVDLQALGLCGVETTDQGIQIGAMTRLQDLVDSDLVPEVLTDLAQREAPRTIRNAATIGGTVASAHPSSQLYAGLLAFGASARLAKSDGTVSVTLDELLDKPILLDGAIITDVTIPTGGVAAADRTGRTPADRPIVAAVAHRDGEGQVRIAMIGVGDTPLLVDPEGLDDMKPPADFRGTSEYRTHLATVLSGRVLDAVSGGAA